MSFFFGLIGVYESLIPLQHMELEYCPSMNHESIILYFKWRTGANGSILTDKNGDPMKDISNDLIKCVGSWLAPTNAEQCRSAVFSLHRSREQKGPFQPSCGRCFSMDQEGQYYGCRYHRMKPRLFRGGNPMTCTEVQDWVKGYMDLNADYVAKGDLPLSPFQLREFRNALLARNSLWDYQIWTMTIVDGVSRLAFASINTDITIVKPGGIVTGIALLVNGKTERSSVTLMLWADNDNPEFCGVRHFLAWIAVSGITSGYLFPSMERLKGLLKKETEGIDVGVVEKQDVINPKVQMCNLDFSSKISEPMLQIKLSGQVWVSFDPQKLLPTWSLGWRRG